MGGGEASERFDGDGGGWQLELRSGRLSSGTKFAT